MKVVHFSVVFFFAHIQCSQSTCYAQNTSTSISVGFNKCVYVCSVQDWSQCPVVWGGLNASFSNNVIW